jgi:hypothetical protein
MKAIGSLFALPPGRMGRAIAADRADLQRKDKRLLKERRTTLKRP